MDIYQDNYTLSAYNLTIRKNIINGADNMNESEYNKLTEDQKAVINEICELINDTRLQDLLKEQLAKDQELLPHIKAELKKARKDPETNNLTVFDVLAAQTDKNARENLGVNRPMSKAEVILNNSLRRLALTKKYPLQPRYDVKQIGMINNTLVNYLQDRQVIGAEPFDLPVMPKRDITAYTTIYFDDESSGNYAGITQFNELERAVSDRLYSLAKYAKEHNTPCLIDGYIIAACMPGGGGKVRPNEAELYNSIIEKFRHLFIYCDCTDEMRARGEDIPEGDTYILNDYYISAMGAEYRTKSGDIKKGYILRDIPLPYTYAEQTGQIITIPAELFDIKETIEDKEKGKIALLDTNVRLTQTRQSIVNYLLRRIYIIKGDHKRSKDQYRKYEAKRKAQKDKGQTPDDFKPLQAFCKMSNLIKFDAIYKKAEIEPTKAEALRLRNFCRDALNYWQAKQIIKGYEIHTGKDASIKIILD